jgi:hypothetical protein
VSGGRRGTKEVKRERRKRGEEREGNYIRWASVANRLNFHRAPSIPASNGNFLQPKPGILQLFVYQ